jgi:Ca-activated chloride channel family protein
VVIDVVAADDSEASHRLQLAATVADLAQVLKRAAPYADRHVTLEDLLERAEELAALDVVGAEDLVALVEQAVAAG